MRIILRVLKNYDNQKIPAFFLTTNGKNKTFTYCFNAPADVYREWSYFRHSQSEFGFRTFFTRFDIAHFSGMFALISILDGRSSLEKFQFFGCNQLMKYFQYTRHCFGVKILKMSAASLEENDYDYVGLSNQEQMKEYAQCQTKEKSIFQTIRKLFKRDTLNAARDQVNYDANNKMFYYQDSVIRIHALDIFSEADQKVKQTQTTKKFAFHVCEREEDKKSIDKERFMKDIPSDFRKMIIAKKIIQIDNKVYKLEDYEIKEEESHFLVLELLTDEEVDHFIRHSYLQGELFKKVEMIVHLSPRNILENPKLSQFIKENERMKHIITASGYYSVKDNAVNLLPFSFLSYNQNLYKIFPHIIPQMNPSFFHAFSKGYKNQNVPIENAPFYNEQSIQLNRSSEQIHFKNNEILSHWVAPSATMYNNHNTKILNESKIYQKLFQKLTNFYQQKVKDLQDPKYVQKYFPEIIPLGTSSSYYTTFRNVSSYLIRLSSDSSILFDCGYSTIFQLRKQYGTFDEFELYKQVKNIKMVVVSHHHSDHHYGIVELIEERNNLFKKYYHLDKDSVNSPEIPKLIVILPNSIVPYIEAIGQQTDINAVIIPHTNVSTFTSFKQTKSFQDVQKIISAWKQDTTDNEDNVLDFQNDNEESVDNLMKDKQVAHYKIFKDALSQMQIQKLIFFPIFHCQGSRSILIETNDKKKIVYSGDGRPSTKFRNFIQGADFLIHECTFTNEQKLQAQLKNHSYFDEVVEFAHSLDVKCLILSHFSTNSTEILLARKIEPIDYTYSYPKNEVLQKYINTNTIFAVDNLIINEQNTQNLPLASRILLKIYGV